MRFNANARKVYEAKAGGDPVKLGALLEAYNRGLGGKMSNGSCPGHFGQGTGELCCMCGGKIQEIS